MRVVGLEKIEFGQDEKVTSSGKNVIIGVTEFGRIKSVGPEGDSVKPAGHDKICSSS